MIRHIRTSYRFQPYTKLARKYILHHDFILQPHQISAIDHVTTAVQTGCDTCLIGMIMGCGKTLIALVCFQRLFKDMLFITPRNAVNHITSQVDQYIPSEKINIMIVAHEDIEQYKNKTIDIIVIDESHMLVKRTKFLLDVKTIQRRFTLLLTGTPGMDSEQSCQLKKLGGQQHAKSFLLDKLDSLRPPRLYLQYMRMTDKQSTHYKTLKLGAVSIATGLSRYHQLKSIRETLSEWKSREIMEIIHRSNITAKIVIFSEFNAPLLKLKELWPDMVCTVDFSASQRSLAIHTFKNSAARVIALKVQHFSHAVDLGFCNGIIFMEPIWRETTRRQAFARLTRLGQVMNQCVLSLVFVDTLETKLVQESMFDSIQRVYTSTER